MRERFMAVWKKLKKKPMSILGIGLIGAFLLIAVAAPWIAPPAGSTFKDRVLLTLDPIGECISVAGWRIPTPACFLSIRDPFLIPQDGYSADPVRPSAAHWFGTTEQQYDLFYGMVWGTRTAFKVALSVVLTSLILGIIIGGVAGFYGRYVDEALMRMTDIVLAFPDMVLAVVLVAVLGPGLSKVMIAVTLVSWPSYARLLRGDVLSIKEREFVLAARALGASDMRIFGVHILPNCIYPLLVVASLRMGRIVITAAALSFLGLGAPLGYADWGQLISLSRNWILGSSGNPFEFWHTLFIPGFAIFMFVLGWNLMGDALRDILDPRQK